MKLFLKENKLLIVIYFFMFVLIVFGVSEYQKGYGYQKQLKRYEEFIEQCDEYDYLSSTEEEQELMSKVCEEYKKNKEEKIKKKDTITIFFYILTTRVLSNIYLVVPLFIMICSVKKWHNYMKNGAIKNMLTREPYYKTIKKSFLNAYKQIFVFLGFIIIIFGISYLISGHFDYTEGLSYDGLVNHDFYNTMPYSLIIFFVILALSYFMYINIALICTKYNKNYYVCVIVSYLLWLALDILVEVIIGGYILWVFFKINTGQTFSLFALYDSWTVKEQFIQLSLTLILALISFIAVYLVYRKREGVVIASEK